MLEETARFISRAKQMEKEYYAGISLWASFPDIQGSLIISVGSIYKIHAISSVHENGHACNMRTWPFNENK